MPYFLGGGGIGGGVPLAPLKSQQSTGPPNGLFSDKAGKSSCPVDAFDATSLPSNTGTVGCLSRVT